MKINYQKLIKELIGTSVPKPLSGTLSGHAAGEPFDKHVYELIKEQFPNNTFRQYEYLNDLYGKNPDATSYEDRYSLFKSPSVASILTRGKDATQKWKVDKPFQEQQDDTADILVVTSGFYEILDVKTRNISKSPRAPNVISSYKLANLCAHMIDNNDYDSFAINYIEIAWELVGNKLVCSEACLGSLFKAHPSSLYINWAAGRQIQVLISKLDQSYDKDVQSWAREYLKNYVELADRQIEYLNKKYMKPFKKYID